MVKRRSKKKGSGSHGHGSSKKNRGAGNRGGRGNAGKGKKAKHEKMTEDGIHQLGEEGFTPYRNREQNGINLKDIDQRIEEYVEAGYAEETDDGYIFYAGKAGYDKVLGGGRLTRNIEIRSPSFSDSAEEKIEESEGEAVDVEE